MIRANAEAGRVTDAAEKLGVTPPALSHRIREAERRLDVRLFTRTQKKLRLTPPAEYLAQAAKRILGELERTEPDARRMNRGDLRPVSHPRESRAVGLISRPRTFYRPWP